MPLPKYRPEYRYNGKPNLFEFYLFINPIGQRCYRCEKDLTDAFRLIAPQVVDFHILPFHNQETTRLFMNRYPEEGKTLAQRNRYFRRIYLASLAYKAASMQGKRLGRKFLFQAQERFDDLRACQSDQEVKQVLEEIARSVHLDLEIFSSDLTSDFVRELFLRDQKIAHEMGVKHTPSLVIFEHQSDSDGIRLENAIDHEAVFRELDQLFESNSQEIQVADNQKIISWDFC
ncbi:DsbA family protein [Hutsoniella sourekii]|uniref:DsbA family protein n=1 Tax=Hutsoniella sourekii TaxID=87650 RepID=UPI0004BC1928|nr:DsbA family protein [Hutsoniella sourekii]